MRLFERNSKTAGSQDRQHICESKAYPVVALTVYRKVRKILTHLTLKCYNGDAFLFFHRLAWGITYTVLLLVITIVITILAVPGQLYPKSNFGLMFLLFFMYGLSLVSCWSIRNQWQFTGTVWCEIILFDCNMFWHFDVFARTKATFEPIESLLFLNKIS